MWGGLPPLSFLVVCFVWAGVVWAGLEGVSRTEAAAGWWVPPCWGWHAVGVLGQCALVAWPVFCCLVWVVGLGVGGLVVNCIVDASILL